MQLKFSLLCQEISSYSELSKERLRLTLVIILPLFFSCILSAGAQTLVWEEDFNTASVNPNTWAYDFGDGSGRPAGFGWGNSELQYYTSRPENVRIENGSLVIEAKRENFVNSAFTSGRIKTEGRIHFKYGTIEARIKIPDVANGLWPAFWTLGTIGGSWPSIGEIDITEIGSASALQAGLGNKRVTSANHWSNASGTHDYYTSYIDAAVDLSADYHLYKLVWTSQFIKVYLDNVEYYSFDISGGAAANLSEFHNPHFLLLNLAVGGAYPNIFDPNAITAPLPGKMLVDYIRLYQNPGDELIIGSNNAVTGNFGVLTETTATSDFLAYGTNAELYYWNNLTNITSPLPVPFEGNNLWAVHAKANDWFGMGIVNNYVNLSNFSAGSLKFHFKSTYAGQFKIGLTTGHGETWINFPAGVQKYGLMRDGNWHEVVIPMADFNNPNAGMNIDLVSLKAAFMFAGDPAISGADFYFDNIYYYQVPTVVLNAPNTAAPEPPVRNASDVISLFSGAYTDVAGTDWFPDWGQSTVVTDTTITGNVTKVFTSLNYEGVSFTPAIDATGMVKLHLDIWTPDCTALDVFLINPGPVEQKVTLTPTLSGWNSFDINLSDYPTIEKNNIFQFKFVGTPFTGSKVYLDNIYFYKVTVPIAPTTAAPTPPIRIPSDVISLFSDAYTDVAGTDWFPNWGQSTVVTDTTIAGNATKVFTNLNYEGVAFTPAIDATGMTKLHLDIWTPDCTALDVFLINPGPVEQKVTVTPTLSGWNSFDINLSDYTTIEKNNIFQFKFVGTPFTGSKVYLDNIYFYKPPTIITNAPTTAAPTPPVRNASDVISLFSGAYTNVAGTDWFPNWGQSTVVSDTTIVGDATKKYENLNYQGVQFATAINASGMTSLHLDIWTPNVITFDVYPIVPGQPEVAKSLTPTVSGWNSYDIDLATIGTSPLSNIIQFKFVGTPSGSKVYLDNIYFWKPAGTVIGIAPTVSITSPANNTQFLAPASITINATAGDADGTVTMVEFYEGANLLGTDNTSPYSFDWNNVPSGNYSITAKVTDNDGNVVTSTPPVAIAVKPVPCTGVAVSGDYSYEVYTQAGTVYFTFHPLAPIAGSNLAIINLKKGAGAYNGYGMTASGTDFIFSKAIANGVNTSFYFTYNTPPAGERNSSADPHSYYVGTVCVPGAPTVSISSPAEAANFTAPATITLNATASDANGTVRKVEFYNGATLLGMDDTSPYSFDWTNVAAGNYALTAKATDNDLLSTTSTPVNIVVNAPNLNGYCGTAVSGDYEYKVETNNGIVTFRLHPLQPIAGCLYAILNVTSPGTINANMVQSGTDFIYSTPMANGSITNFFFTYNTPPAGERNSSANKHSYTVGTNCMGISGTTPVVNITSPVNNASFTEPATVTINATATDNDGTISKVEFYNGATFLGMDDTSPFSFDWTNVAAGNYTVSAWATDNDGYTAISNLVDIVVNINNSGGFCGTIANGDYSYKAETINGNVVITFHPEAPIAGCTGSLIYIREGLSGGYPGYLMTKIGSDFRFTKAIAIGTPISIYFTYNTPPSGERNSSATPHSYTVGDVCLGGAPTVSITSPAQSASFLEPANITITADASDANGTVSKVEFYNGSALLGMDDTAPYSFDWTNIPAGAYTLRAKATDNSALVTNSAPVNITVNAPNTNGYCGTAVGGDYAYRVETIAGNVTFTFYPLAPIAGCNLAIIFIQEGGSGGFPGYTMTASGTDFVFTKTISGGTPLTFYFTYNTPPAGERNSSGNPHNYTVGAICFTPVSDNTISLTSAVGTNAQTVCINTAITNITYSTTGATGATFSGLPTGVTGNWAANLATISGTPTASGAYSYTVTLTGGSGSITATGSVAVTPVPTITCPGNQAANNTPGLCSAVINYSSSAPGTPAPAITYAFTGATTGSGSGNGSGSVFNVGATNVTLTATNTCGTETCSFTVTVTDNEKPTIIGESASLSALWPPNHTMRDVTVNYTSTDNCGIAGSCILSVTSNEPINGAGDGDTSPDWIIVDDHHLKLRAERASTGNGRIYSITITCTDASGNSTSKSVDVVVAHDITLPISGASFKIGSTVILAGTFWDKPGNKHTAQWLIDNTKVTGSVTAEPSGLKNGRVTGSYKFGTAGVYKLRMNVNDQTGLESYSTTNGDLEAIVIIYDPNGGHAFGGGYFMSPKGALKSNSNATGKVSYGFNSNYFKGATNPKGETQMQFQVGNFEFNALNFDYLAISGAKAQFKGSGKIVGDQAGYNFIMTVIDGELNGTGVDKMRLKIYNKNTGAIIYDNQPGASEADDPTTVVAHGSTIVIVNPTANGAVSKAITSNAEIIGYPGLQSNPNPFNSSTTIRYMLPKDAHVSLSVYDNLGRKLAVLAEGRMSAGSHYLRFDASSLPGGIYICRLHTVDATGKPVVLNSKMVVAK